MITDKLASYGAAKREIMPASSIDSIRASTTERRTRISRHADESGK